MADELDDLISRTVQDEKEKQLAALMEERKAQLAAGDRGFINALTLGLGEEGVGALTGALQAGANLLGVGERASPLEAYRAARDEEIRKNQEVQQRYLGDYIVGNIGGALTTSRALPSLSAGQTVSLLQKARLPQALAAKLGPFVANLANTTAQGAVLGAGESKADLTKGEVGRFAGDVGSAATQAGATALGLGAGTGTTNYLRQALGKRAARMPEQLPLLGGGVTERAKELGKKYLLPLALGAMGEAAGRALGIPYVGAGLLAGGGSAQALKDLAKSPAAQRAALRAGAGTSGFIADTLGAVSQRPTAVLGPMMSAFPSQSPAPMVQAPVEDEGDRLIAEILSRARQPAAPP